MPIFLVGFSHLKLCLKGQMKLNLQPTPLQTQSSNSEYTVSACVCNVCMYAMYVFLLAVYPLGPNAV